MDDEKNGYGILTRSDGVVYEVLNSIREILKMIGCKDRAK